MLDFDQSRIKLLVLDSDGVTVPRGTCIKETHEPDYTYLTAKTYSIPHKLALDINELQIRGLNICINSGRSLLFLQSMYSPIIADKTALLAENGNLIMFHGRIYQTALYGWSYFNALSVIRNAIKDILMDKVTAIEPKEFILTVFAEDRVPEVEKLVEGFEFLKCMWNGEAYDIQYKHMSKGFGLKKLRRLMHVKKNEVVAVGDRINDKELLDEAGIGITVDPIALPAKYWASSGQEVVDYMLRKELYAES